MIEFSRHIEYLMLKHDCVIIPKLGGFIAQYMPARYIEQEGIFIPPYRSIGFNDRLCLNDGLLVQSYMRVHGTSYAVATNLVESAVDALKRELYEKGEVQLGNLGCLGVAPSGGFSFTPSESGIATPSLYGLSSFELSVNQSNSSDKIKRVSEKRENRNYVLKVNKELVNYISAAVITLFFYFIWSTPLSDTKVPTLQQASVVPSAIKSNHDVVQPKESEAEFVHVLEETPTIDTHSYVIVLASCIPENNANEFAEKLENQGLEKVKVYQKSKMIRVVYGNYKTEQEAYADLAKQRKNNIEHFASAWVLLIK